MEEFDRCYRAVCSRDPRFDGWFVTAVTSTRIYCRPSCPARTPHPRNVRFFPTGAAAQRAGFRACLRCRPDAVPGSPEWNVRSDVVARAMRLIADGVVEREGVGGLARRLGYGPRHLHRLLSAEVGAGPLGLARAQRVHAARLLIETTELPMADVAFAAGFASVRQFNDTVQAVLGRTPTALRSRRDTLHAEPGVLSLRLPARHPIDATGLLGFLGARAVAGVETWDGTTYARTLRLPHGAGWVALCPGDGHVAARLALADLRDLAPAVGRCRRLFDLDADPVAVGETLGADPVLAPIYVPGRRVAGGEGFEVAVRALVIRAGSPGEARRSLARLVARLGPALPLGGAPSGLTHLFPDAREIAAAPSNAGATTALGALAADVASGRLDLRPGADPSAAVAHLGAMAGVGEVVAELVAMRAFGDPDVFSTRHPATRRVLKLLGLPHDPRRATEMAERWRPWRSYAQECLWSVDPGRAAPHPR